MGRELGLARAWEKVRAARADLRASRARAEQLVGITHELDERLAALERQIDQLCQQQHHHGAQARLEHDRVMHGLRVVRDDDARNWTRLWELRRSEEYELAFTDPEPLVTILITTYSNWRLMRERAIPSVLAQRYENWECIVVGDHAPSEAGEVVDSFGDPRLRFVNLPYRGPYPAERDNAWLVSGTTPWNTGLALSRGRWVGSVSDDDALAPEYIETLLNLARTEHAEVAYGQLRQHEPGGKISLLGTFPPTSGGWGTQCSLLHAGLKYMPLHGTDWIFAVANDWGWADRMLRIGVRFVMIDEPVADYFPSRSWTDRPPVT